MEDVQKLLETLRALWAPVALVYALVLISSLARFHPATVQEILRRQGTASLVVGTLGATAKAIAPAVVLVCAFLLLAGRPTDWPRRALVIVAGLAAVLVASFTALGAAVAVAGLLVLRPRRKLRRLLFVLGVVILAWIAVVSPVGVAVTAPWLPIERLSLRDGDSVRGYVLGEDAGRLSVLRRADRTIEWVPVGDVTDRHLCEPPNGFWAFDAPSIVELWSPRYQTCLTKATPDSDRTTTTTTEPPSCCTTSTTEPPSCCTTSTTEPPSCCTTSTTEPPSCCTTSTIEPPSCCTTSTTEPPSCCTTSTTEPPSCCTTSTTELPPLHHLDHRAAALLHHLDHRAAALLHHLDHRAAALLHHPAHSAR